MTSKHQFGDLVILMVLVMMAVTSVDTRPTPSLPRKRRPALAVDPVARQQHKLRQSKDLITVNRWLTPCGGGDVADIPAMEVGDLALSKSDSTTGVDTIRLAERTDQLIKDIDNLKKHYADHRFKDTVQNLDQLGFILDGLPKLASRRRTDATLPEVINQAIVDLSAVAPFIELALDGERQFEHGHHYTDSYQRLIDHPKHGFYTVLCELTRMRSILNGDSDTRRPGDGAAAPNSSSVVNSAIRHYRDYIVLRDLRKLLHRLRSELRLATR